MAANSSCLAGEWMGGRGLCKEHERKRGSVRPVDALIAEGGLTVWQHWQITRPLALALFSTVFFLFQSCLA